MCCYFLLFYYVFLHFYYIRHSSYIWIFSQVARACKSFIKRFYNSFFQWNSHTALRNCYLPICEKSGNQLNQLESLIHLTFISCSIVKHKLRIRHILHILEELKPLCKNTQWLSISSRSGLFVTFNIILCLIKADM